VLLYAQHFPHADENRSEDDIAVMNECVMIKPHFLIQCTLQCNIFLNNLWMPSLAQMTRDAAMPVGACSRDDRAEPSNVAVQRAHGRNS